MPMTVTQPALDVTTLEATLTQAQQVAAGAATTAADARQMVVNDRASNRLRFQTLQDVADQFDRSIAAADAEHARLQQEIDAATAKPGAPGADGLPGVPGERGAPGAPGTPGTPGRDGTDGTPGRAGADGAQGARGLTGVAGRDGVDGVTPQLRIGTIATGAAGAAAEATLTGTAAAPTLNLVLPRGATGVAGTTNLQVTARPVALLALGGSATVVLPWSRAMPAAVYDVRFAHTSVATLGQVTYEVTAQTTTSVTVKVTAAIALAAGTLIAVGY